MLRTASMLLAAVIAFDGFAQAQTVVFRGQIEDVQGTQNQFFLDCTDTSLTSSAFNLNLFMNQSLEITGNWNGSFTNPSVEVTALTPVVESFEIGGGAKIGETSNMTWTGAPGSVAIGRIALDTAFVPLGGDTGVLFLDLSTSVLGRNGVIGGGGILQSNFFIPDNPSLVGLDIYGQGAIITGGVVTLTNPDCKEIDN